MAGRFNLTVATVVVGGAVGAIMALQKKSGPVLAQSHQKQVPKSPGLILKEVAKDIHEIEQEVRADRDRMRQQLGEFRAVVKVLRIPSNDDWPE